MAWGNRPLPLARGPARLAVHFRREAQKHPYVAKALPTAIGFAFGDLLTQYMNRDKSRGLREQYRPHRSVLMFAAGAVVAAPVLLVFNRWMDVHLLPQAAGTPALEAAKFLLDQIVGCLFWQSAYISIVPSYRASAQQLIDGTATKLSAHGEVLLMRGKALLPSA